MHQLRIIGGKNYIRRISLSAEKLIINFHEKFMEEKTRFEKLLQQIHTLAPFKSRFKQGESLQLHIIPESGDFIADNFSLTKKLLQEII